MVSLVKCTCQFPVARRDCRKRKYYERILISRPEEMADAGILKRQEPLPKKEDDGRAGGRWQWWWGMKLNGNGTEIWFSEVSVHSSLYCTNADRIKHNEHCFVFIYLKCRYWEDWKCEMVFILLAGDYYIGSWRICEARTGRDWYVNGIFWYQLVFARFHETFWYNFVYRYTTELRVIISSSISRNEI